MFEQVDFSCFSTIVRKGCPSFVFVSFFGLFLVGIFNRFTLCKNLLHFLKYFYYLMPFNII
jgi:hypothetical protein